MKKLIALLALFGVMFLASCKSDADITASTPGSSHVEDSNKTTGGNVGTGGTYDDDLDWGPIQH